MNIARYTCKAVLYIPTPICVTLQDFQKQTPLLERIKSVQEELTRKFGGASQHACTGTYLNSCENIERETTYKIEVWFQEPTTANWLYFKSLAEELCRDLKQQSFMFEYDNVAYFVNGEEGV
jgi:hypothetical protein